MIALLFFDSNAENSHQQDGGLLKKRKKKKKANIFEEYLHDMLFPLFWERRRTPETHSLIKIKIILLKYVGGTLSKKLGGNGHYLEFR